ncbi:MAG: hypothetical protein V3U02_04375 [Calditrichia bacterium]
MSKKKDEIDVAVFTLDPIKAADTVYSEVPLNYPFPIYYRFSTDKFVMQSQSWEMTLTISSPIRKVHRSYRLSWIVDLSYYRVQLENNAKRMEKHKAGMIEEINQSEMAEMREDRDKIIESAQKREENCLDITFSATVTHVDYKPDKTIIKFNVPKDIINRLNDRLEDLREYKINLEHLV